MPQGSKDKYTEKQKRKAEHIAEGYEKKGTSDDKAKSIAWATVNKQSGGGEKSGEGRTKPASAKKSARKSSAKTAVQTKKAGKRVAPSSANVTNRKAKADSTGSKSTGIVQSSKLRSSSKKSSGSTKGSTTSPSNRSKNKAAGRKAGKK